MKITIKQATATLLFWSLCSLATAECVKPAPPELPDPTQAVTPEMVSASNKVKAYMSLANEYLECINDVAMHNQMVVEMEELAAHFNDIIRKYKARLKQ